jgi:hypothetical protein
MIPTIGRRVETQQSDSLAAVTQFVGFPFNPLPSSTFFLGNPVARENLELLDVNPIGEKISLAGHAAGLLPCGSEQIVVSFVRQRYDIRTISERLTCVILRDSGGD